MNMEHLFEIQHEEHFDSSDTILEQMNNPYMLKNGKPLTAFFSWRNELPFNSNSTVAIWRKKLELEYIDWHKLQLHGIFTESGTAVFSDGKKVKFVFHRVNGEFVACEDETRKGMIMKEISKEG